MARNWLFGARTKEVTSQQLAASGAGGSMGVDPIDGDTGYTQLGQSFREQPRWTTEKARAYSINAYRTNPIARSVIDTFTSFCVGDSGVAPQCDNEAVRQVVDEWWHDPRNQLGPMQTLLCRDWLMMGENVWEYMVGPTTGRVRYSPISPSRITDVYLEAGNPLWHHSLQISGHDAPMLVANVDDVTELRTGQVGFFPSFRTLITDRRGVPFLAPILDDIDAYGQVISNLVDRTALSRYLVWDVEIDGNSDDIDKWVKDRGGMHVPRSGSIEVHNKKVKWAPQTVSSGSFEDTNTALSVLTNVAAGAGLAKHWIAEPQGANRATSMTMAEPVRRRVGGVQIEWLNIMTEHARFAVDQAVRVGRLPRLISTTDAAGTEVMIAPAQLVRIAGPEIAAADSQVTAAVLLNLSQAVQNMVDAQVLTVEAGALAVEKGWEQFVGRPFPRNLAASNTVELAPDATTEAIEDAHRRGHLFPVAN